MRYILHIANKSLFVVAILALLISTAYILLIAFFGAGSKRIIYPIVFTTLTGDLWTLGVIIFFVVGIVFIALILMAGVTKTKFNTRIGAQAVLLMIFTNALPFVVSIALFILPGTYRSTFSEWENVSDANLNNHLYHLVYYTPDAVEGSFYYHLYKCDSFNLFCEEIYSKFGLYVIFGLGKFFAHNAKNLI